MYENDTDGRLCPIGGHRASKNKAPQFPRRVPGPYQFRSSGVLRDNMGLAMTGMNARARDTCMVCDESQICSQQCSWWEVDGRRH